MILDDLQKTSSWFSPSDGLWDGCGVRYTGIGMLDFFSKIIKFYYPIVFRTPLVHQETDGDAKKTKSKKWWKNDYFATNLVRYQWFWFPPSNPDSWVDIFAHSKIALKMHLGKFRLCQKWTLRFRICLSFQWSQAVYISNSIQTTHWKEMKIYIWNYKFFWWFQHFGGLKGFFDILKEWVFYLSLWLMIVFWRTWNLR